MNNYILREKLNTESLSFFRETKTNLAKHNWGDRVQFIGVNEQTYPGDWHDSPATTLN
jgi:hypothetical protein